MSVSELASVIVLAKLRLPDPVKLTAPTPEGTPISESVPLPVSDAVAENEGTLTRERDPVPVKSTVPL